MAATAMKRTGERNETPPLSIELEIPTLTLGGVVGVRLIVAGGHALTLSLRVEGGEEPAFWRGAVQALKEELAADGWQLGAVDIKEWCHAKSSRFTL